MPAVSTPQVMHSRRFPRVEVTFPVRIEAASGQSWTGAAVNLSPCGIKVRNGQIAPPALVHLEFDLPAGGPKFTSLAVAMRSDPDGKAFAFVNLAKRDFLRIRQQVESLFLRRQLYIMVVDDDRNVAEGLADSVEELGYATLIMPNAEEALAYLTHDQPDAILLDLRLPGMSGLQFLETLVRRDIRLPVVVISGVQEADAVSCLKAGAFDFLRKPLDMEQFHRTLNMLELTSTQQRLDTLEFAFRLAF